MNLSIMKLKDNVKNVSLILLLLIFVTSSVLCQIEQKLNTIFISQPNNDIEFENLFNSKPRIKDEKIYSLEYGDLIDESNEVVKGNSIASLEEAIAFHNEKIDNYLKLFIIVGHNENGIFKFSNGDGISFEKLEKLLVGNQVVFLSCNSNEYIDGVRSIGLDTKISFREAFSILDNLDNYSTKSCSRFLTSEDDLKVDIPRVINEAITNNNIKKMSKVSIVVIGGGGTIYYVTSTKNKDETSTDTIRVN